MNQSRRLGEPCLPYQAAVQAKQRPVWRWKGAACDSIEEIKTNHYATAENRGRELHF